MKINSIYTLHDHFRQRQHSSHYDLRILSPSKKFALSFAFPKKKFPENNERILAIRTPDHPLSVLDLQGELDNGDKMRILENDKCDYISITPSKIDMVFYGKIVKGHFIFINTHEDSWLVLAKRV